MKPETLSATAILTFQGCEARFRANYIDRAKEMSGSAAELGTAGHNTLERWVVEGYHYPRHDYDLLREIFDEEYAKIFGSDNSRRDEGRKMMKNWWERSGDEYWEGRTVLSTEQKRTFDLKLPDGTVIPFTYIMDRMDELSNGDIDVVDYKSVSAPVQPEEMKERIQPRSYALAAQIEFPDAPAIWMNFDLLRYDIVGQKFSREDNIKTWKYLQEVAQQILESDGTRETLNPECRWCVRKHECRTLNAHVDAGGVLGITELDDAIDRRAELNYKLGALRTVMDELDHMILDQFEEQELIDHQTANTKVNINVSSRREADSERIIKVIGPSIAARYGKIGVTDLDKILKDEELTDDQKSQLKQLVRKKLGKASVKTKPLHPFGEDDE